MPQLLITSSKRQPEIMRGDEIAKLAVEASKMAAHCAKAQPTKVPHGRRTLADFAAAFWVKKSGKGASDAS